MSLARKIATNTGSQLIGKTLSTILGLIAVFIMTRALGPEKFGWYATAAGFLQFIGLFSDFGFTLITTHLLSEAGADKEKILYTSFTWRLTTSFLFNGLAALIIFLFPYPVEVKLAVVIMSLSFFLIGLNQVFVALYQSRLQSYIHMIGEVLGRIVLVLGVGLASFYNAGFYYMVGAITFASLIFTAYLWIKSGGIKLQLDRATSRQLFHAMWPTALAVIFNSFYLQGDRVILPLFVDQSTVGLYAAAYRVLDIITQLAALAMGIMLPLLTYAWSKGDKKEFASRAQTSLDLLSLILLPMTLASIALATPLITFVGGQEFASAGPILRALSFAVFGIVFGMTFGHIALSINRQRQALWIYFSDAILSVVAYFIFIPRYGVWGAIGVTIFSELVAGIALAILAIYYSKFHPRLFTFTKILLASLIMSVVLYLLRSYSVVLLIPLGVIIYGLLVILLKIVSKDTIKDILKPTPEKIA
ncbi:MAG TPA: flippase [Patescibacteria group bacterium]|nr:flippase [Patescibacteria group bacterium]